MNAFPPYALLDARAVEDAADKTRRLERLYDMTRERAWDGKAVLHELIEKHIDNGAPPEDLVDELVKQCNSTFGHYNIEYIRRVESELVL